MKENVTIQEYSIVFSKETHLYPFIMDLITIKHTSTDMD